MSVLFIVIYRVYFSTFQSFEAGTTSSEILEASTES